MVKYVWIECHFMPDDPCDFNCRIGQTGLATRRLAGGREWCGFDSHYSTNVCIIWKSIFRVWVLCTMVFIVRDTHDRVSLLWVSRNRLHVNMHFIYMQSHRIFGCVVVHLNLVEVAIGEHGWRDKGPHVETHAQPRGCDLDPHRSNVFLRQLRTRAEKLIKWLA